MRYTISILAASLLALPALAAPPAVVTDIPPVQSLVAMVMGDLGTPGLILPPGADAHDIQLRPSQAQAIADAGLVVWVGPQMSPWMDGAVDGLAGESVALSLLDVPGTALRSYGRDHAAEDAAQDHDHEGHDHEGHNHAGHDHTGTDPHAWLDPANARLWVSAIAQRLSALDPGNAATYAANARTATAAINAAEAQAAARLAPVRDRPIVVFHDAYGYFAAHFGLTVAGAITPGDAAAPGAGRLRDLQARVGAQSALCVFPEANHNPALAAQLAQAGARLGGPLDPEGASLPAGPALYPMLLTGLADTIAGCLDAAS